MDQTIAVSLIVAFSALLIPVLLWLLKHQIWWWQASILTFVFILFFWFIQPTLIAPLFYKFTELEDEGLKKRITELIQRSSAKIPKIYVMNASKRTKKQNAYVTGIGRSRRLVLYDTIMNYPSDELLAVVAHELGHHVKKHIQKDVILFSIYATFLLYLTNFVYQHILKIQHLRRSKTSHDLRVFFSLRFDHILLLGASRELPFEEDGIRGRPFLHRTLEKPCRYDLRTEEVGEGKSFQSQSTPTLQSLVLQPPRTRGEDKGVESGSVTTHSKLGEFFAKLSGQDGDITWPVGRRS